jgi:hypothetical protein
MVEREEKVITNISEVKVEPSKYTKTFTSFSGADMVIYLDNKVIGEAQEVKWEKDLTGGRTWPIKGELICTLFDREPLQLEDKDYEILITYLNDYGQGMVEEFSGIRFHRMRGGMSIDSICGVVTYEFTASRRELKGSLTGEEVISERQKKFKAWCEE